MINHARTLLLNRKGEIVPTSYYLGEEYVPVYPGIALEPSLARVAGILYGTSPDYESKLFRTAQYMAILHSTEFVEYVTALDSRITYDVSHPGLVGLEYGLEIVTASEAALAVVGTWSEPAYLGRMRNDWVVEATGANQILVRHVQSGATQGQVLTFGVGSSSNAFPLIGSDFTAIITDPDGLAGDRWEIRYREPPGHTLSDVVANLESMSRITRQALFGLGSEEPYQTFRNLFDKNQALPFRLSGALLALIYRMEALRNP